MKPYTETSIVKKIFLRLTYFTNNFPVPNSLYIIYNARKLNRSKRKKCK